MPQEDKDLTKLMQSVMQNYQHWLEIDTEFLPLQERVGNAVKAFTNSQTGTSSVLAFEGGCGTGITTETILNSHEQIVLLSVDTSAEMIQVTRERLSDKFSGRYLTLADDFVAGLHRITSADIIVTALTIHNMSTTERRELMHLIGQKLRPGGIFINGDKIVLNDEAAYEVAFKKWIDRLDRFKELGLHEIYDFYYAHEMSDRENRFTESEQQTLIQEAGLTDYHFDRIGMYALATARKPLE